ncbi:GNAT family N-acetyltransferase [Legionella oakridgensis]|uniref:Acetyltransferase n=2 Tax=Legionella oakridgensis TaxID=29423 RepID=W0BC28_9GAMM|nr:GNAT family N-acetyltransferase [Legionella oakridgensis]AHE68093.1 hypothetical protein Loa_02556 [Legionella oakridgensis ATCC 33761 = DSM 21215]ETO92403.1 hypothetical protein LOR_24c02000 [Legionella oakridgensis RV-2-2007]KTD42555.1 aminoglycoside 6'-N-acetyltransferase [Legionella oakridgensis]STY21071.1 aminoglycoside 6'-N-acetyltransferase [Legionella longbeachae]
MSHFKFKSLSEEDLILLYQWFQEPVIHQWYAGNKNWSFAAIKEKFQPRILGHEEVPGFIAYRNHVPVGFIQYYCLKSHLPAGIYRYNNPLFKRFD